MKVEFRITGPVLKVLLAFLSDPYKELCGADIRRMKKISVGTLYPILSRLEKAGWLESRWEEVDAFEAGRPRKRLYLLTRTGARRAAEVVNEYTGEVFV